ncbi:unnamed protein product, partial [Ceratitis capitata]
RLLSVIAITVKCIAFRSYHFVLDTYMVQFDLPVLALPQTYELEAESVEEELNNRSTSYDPNFKEEKDDQPQKLSQS